MIQSQSDLIEWAGKEGWQKDWEGKFSVLNCLSATPYYYTCYEELGTRTDHVIVFHNRGIATCLLDKKDNAKFGGDLAKRAIEDQKFFGTLAKMALDEFGEFKKLTMLSPQELATREGFEKVVQRSQRYSVAMIAMKSLVNAIPEELRAAAEPMFEARRTTETFYFDLETLLERVAEEIGRQAGYPTELVESARGDEVRAYLAGSPLPSKELLAARYERCAFLYSKDVTEFDRDGVAALENAIYAPKSGDVSGQTAYPGVVRGQARVITDFGRQKDTFKKGEILVTGMTDPTYMPLIYQASAIVTDTGGLLCHAAIVARELKVPCIIGTEVATRTFKDGDMLEVDADKGIVKILK